MSYKYAVLGSGQMGVASGYDMAKFGEAEAVLMIDSDKTAADDSAALINELIGKDIAEPIQQDASDTGQLKKILSDADSLLSAVPFSFNLDITRAAIETNTNMCDLGGHTGIVRNQLELNESAKKAGVSIVPDCGMGPGMNISLAVYAMSLVDHPKEIFIWDGGLPQVPKPPWNYALTFNIGGLSNEYYGNAYFLRNGKVTEVPCFEGYEELDFPEPLGRLEAFVTSGGLSTAPWTFEGKLQALENKTLRYPGHCAQFKAYSMLGLLEEEPVLMGDLKVIPREVFHALLGPKIIVPHVKDVGIIRVKCVGEKDGNPAEAIVELIDRFSEETGFTAMQRLTGWHASIVAIMAAKGESERGAKPVELAVPGSRIVDEARMRGFKIEEKITFMA